MSRSEIPAYRRDPGSLISRQTRRSHRAGWAHCPPGSFFRLHDRRSSSSSPSPAGGRGRRPEKPPRARRQTRLAQGLGQGHRLGVGLGPSPAFEGRWRCWKVCKKRRWCRLRVRAEMELLIVEMPDGIGGARVGRGSPAQIERDHLSNHAARQPTAALYAASLARADAPAAGAWTSAAGGLRTSTRSMLAGCDPSTKNLLKLKSNVLVRCTQPIDFFFCRGPRLPDPAAPESGPAPLFRIPRRETLWRCREHAVAHQAPC